MSKTDLFCLAYAPIQGTALDNIQSEEFVIENVKKEIEYLSKMTSLGFNCFLKYIEKKRFSSDDKTEDAGVMLYCLSSFFERIQNLTGNAAKLAESSLKNGYPEIANAIKELTSVATSTGFVPFEENIEKYFDTSADSEWETPPLARGKVGFRQSVSIIKSDNNDSNFETPYAPPQDGKDFTRKKARQATGYAKFNFKDLDEEENRLSSNERPHASSTTTGSTNISEKNSNHNNNKSNKPSKSPKASAANPPSSTSSSAPSKTKTDYSFIKSCWGLCGGFKCDEESTGNKGELVRRESSVILGNIEEIEDRDSDRHWHDNNRHSQRFTRIRNRKPTGHPSLLAGTSDEMIDMLESMDSEDINNANILQRNTEKNI